MGIPPVGKEVSMPGIRVMGMCEGKVVERWANADRLGLRQQLGAIPAPVRSMGCHGPEA